MKEKFNHEYFTNPQTPEAAYILGLLWSDGFAEIPYRVTFRSAEEDLIQLKPFFEKTGNWTYNFCPRRYPTWKDLLCIRCSSKEFINFLIENDYKAKSYKSACKILSVIPDNLKRYWFRGLSDGDGSFYLQKTTKEEKNGRKICFTCNSGVEQDWTYLKKLLDELEIKYFENRRTRIMKRNGHSSSESTIEFYKFSDIMKFASYLYPDLIFDGMGFKRKFDKIIAIKEYGERVSTPEQKEEAVFKMLATRAANKLKKLQAV